MSSVGVTAETFLEAMFADALPSTHTMLTAFVGDPSTADRAAWAGRPWRPGERVPSWYRAANAYLTVSTFEPDPDTGELRRRKANFAQLHAVMVDDLGTKIPLGVVRLPFSALVETSPRNWQGWYFLRDDADAHDRVKAETLIARMVAAGLTKDGKDPGMKGVTRYGRLPIGVNAKAAYVEQLGPVAGKPCNIATAGEPLAVPRQRVRPTVDDQAHGDPVGARLELGEQSIGGRR